MHYHLSTIAFQIFIIFPYNKIIRVFIKYICSRFPWHINQWSYIFQILLLLSQVASPFHSPLITVMKSPWHDHFKGLPWFFSQIGSQKGNIGSVNRNPKIETIREHTNVRVLIFVGLLRTGYFSELKSTASFKVINLFCKTLSL